MKNRDNFLPKRYKQPNYYTKIFSGWCAVYIHPNTGVKYHIQLNPNILSSDRSVVSYIQVLRQDNDCRRPISGHLKTMKSAVEIIEKLLSDENGEGE